MHFVDVGKLKDAGLPVYPYQFEELVRNQCVKTREHLKKT